MSSGTSGVSHKFEFVIRFPREVKTLSQVAFPKYESTSFVLAR
jgi:hypothetical protein